MKGQQNQFNPQLYDYIKNPDKNTEGKVIHNGIR